MLSSKLIEVIAMTIDECFSSIRSNLRIQVSLVRW